MKRFSYLPATLFSLAVFPLQAFAQSADLMSSIPTLLIGLVVMLALIYVLAGLAKKTNFMQLKSSGMKVLSVLPLSGREKIMLIEVGKQQMVIGVTAHNINLIQSLDEPIDIQTQDFKQTFGKLMQQKNNQE